MQCESIFKKNFLIVEKSGVGKNFQKIEKIKKNDDYDASVKQICAMKQGRQNTNKG